MILSGDIKILYITAVDLSLERGPGINEREFVIELNKTKGVQPYYLIPKPKKHLPVFLNLSGKISYHIRNNFYNPIVYILHMLSMVGAYFKITKHMKFDLIVFRLDIFPLAPFIIAYFTSIPYAIKTLEYFDYFKYQNGFKGFLGKILYPISTYLHNQLVNNAISVDVCTKEFITYFRKRLNIKGDNLHYIDNAVNLKRFKPLDTFISRKKLGLNCFQSIVGFVGSRPLERGGLQLITVAPSLIEKYDNIGFVVVGGSSQEVELLIQKAKKANIIDHFVFKGQISYEYINLYINSYDVCVAFDLNSRTDKFGNASQKIRQYVACGKPVVTGEKGNAFIRVEKIGSIVKPDDVEGITEALDYWLSFSYDLKQHLRVKAYKYAMDNLSITQAVQKRIDIWSHILIKCGAIASK